MNVTIRYAGTDFWGRAAFQSDNGLFYKSMDFLDPDGGFPNAPREEQERIFCNPHTSEPCDDPEGEPGWPVDLEKFTLAND